MNGWWSGSPDPSSTADSSGRDSGCSPFEKLNGGGAGRGACGGGVLAGLRLPGRKKNAELSTAPTISITKEEADVMAAAAAAAMLLLLLLLSWHWRGVHQHSPTHLPPFLLLLFLLRPDQGYIRHH